MPHDCRPESIYRSASFQAGKIPGVQCRNCFPLDTHPLGGADLGLDSACNGGRDLVLQVEKLLQIAIVTLSP